MGDGFNRFDGDLTKFPVVIPLRQATAEREIEDLFLLFGMPRILNYNKGYSTEVGFSKVSSNDIVCFLCNRSRNFAHGCTSVLRSTVSSVKKKNTQ